MAAPAASPRPASTRYLLFLRTLLLAALLLDALYAADLPRALAWIQVAFPLYGACAVALWALERRGKLPPRAAPWSFLVDLTLLASAGLALPAQSTGFFVAFFLVILGSTLLRKPAFSFLLAGAACVLYLALTGLGPGSASDPGRLLKPALLVALAFFSTFMTTYAGQIERSTAEPLEKRIAWMERLSLAGRALAGVLHEVRTPLGTILLTVENARRRLARGEPAEAELDEISREAERASEILAGFLEFTKPVELELAPLPLGVPLDKVCAAMRLRLEERGISLERPPADPARVRGSERHLIQAFTNLCMNALQAMPSGGTLSLLQTHKDGFVEVRVRDTGAGLDPRELESVFEPALCPVPGAKGFGLGLGIARWIVQKHGGELRLESAGPGKGATAVVRLPLS